jgi:hypothetical protein
MSSLPHVGAPQRTAGEDGRWPWWAWLVHVVATAVALHQVFRGWRWADPGIDRSGNLLSWLAIIVMTGISMAVVAVRFERSAHRVRISSLISGGVVLAMGAAAFLAGHVAFAIYGGGLRAEAAHLRAGKPAQSVSVRGEVWVPSDGHDAALFFPRCTKYTGGVWCPDGSYPSYGGTGDRTLSLGDGWYILY